MKTNLLAGLVIFFCTFHSFAQTSVWYFGNNGGLRFTGSGTAPEPGSVMNTNEGCTAATDNSGNLLFYADGQRIWHGATHTNVTSTMLGSPSATQSAIVIPLPGNFCTKFLVITSEGVETTPATPNGIGVSLVTVTGTYPSHSILYDPAISILGPGTRFSEKLAVTPDGNGGWWLVAHDFDPGTSGGTRFYKFHITNTSTFTGITSTAGAQAALMTGMTTQIIGIPHNSTNYNAQGQMKFSLSGTKLGLALCGSKFAETFNFNLSTGAMTLDKSINVGGSGNTYGFEFSPNGNLIYVGQGFAGVGATCHLYQYDITTAVPAPVSIASAVAASGNHYPFNGLQLGPDNRIYVSGPFVGLSSLSVLNTPDISGTGSGWSANSVPITGTRTLGLPTVISGQVSCDVPPTSGCACNGVNAKLISLNLLNSNGNASASFDLSSGGNLIKKVRITLLNYVILPSSDLCRNYCSLNNADFGHFVSPAATLSGYTAVFSPYAGSTSATFSNDIELTTSSPRVITNELLTLNLKFPPILALSCCSQTVRACFRVEFIDANCKICDVLICNTQNGVPSDQKSDRTSGEQGIENGSFSAMASQLSVYPNPNNGNFIINTAKIGTDCRYQLTSLEGREIESGTIRGESHEIRKQNLPPGTYSVFVFKEYQVFKEKIVVVRE